MTIRRITHQTKQKQFIRIFEVIRMQQDGNLMFAPGGIPTVLQKNNQLSFHLNAHIFPYQEHSAITDMTAIIVLAVTITYGGC